MATSAPANSVSFRVPENITFSRDFNQFLLQFTDIYQKLAVSSNAKDIALYEVDQEILNGQTFSGANPQTKVAIYRKCFAFNIIAPGATLNIAHGIIGINRVTRVYGTCITALPEDRPIPYSDTIAITNQISIRRNGPNIIVVNGATAPAITSGRVIMEYAKN